mmetsp:Transcript_24533/g.55087  ORF Transcript_24533/g.55087 Transcript_24533/m.55087 type:complete len:361 (-) Transcript_24533:14-1096(-)
MGKEVTPEPRAARSTRGIPAPKLGSSSENENQTARQPKPRKSRKNKGAGVPRKSRMVKVKMPRFFLDVWEGYSEADWDDSTAQWQQQAQEGIDLSLKDGGNLPLPRRYVQEGNACSREFSWYMKSAEEQTAVILQLGVEARERKKEAKVSNRAALAAALEATALATAGEGNGGGGGAVEGDGGVTAGGAGVTAAARVRTHDRRTRTVRYRIMQLHKTTAELNEILAELQRAGGPASQLMLVEVDDQAPANTGGGTTAAAKLVREKRLLRITALEVLVPKYLAGILGNAFSSQPAKRQEDGCDIEAFYSVEDVDTMITTETNRRARAPTTNHAQSLADIIVNNNLPLPGQSYAPAPVPANT